MKFYYIFYSTLLFYTNFIFGFKHNLKKLSLLSKLIYEYDFVNVKNERADFVINSNINFGCCKLEENTMKCIDPPNISIDFIKKNNIYLNLIQHVKFLDKKIFFTRKTEKYFNILNETFPETEIYGYFYNKNRLHSLILLNHEYKEIIVVFRGSQYAEEWVKNFILCDTVLPFNKDFRVHKGILSMYSDHDVDKNIFYILKNLFQYLPDYKKIFTGHSKGATNCFLLATELLEMLGESTDTYEIYTFGNPSIFNYKYADYLHNHPRLKINNVMNDLDIITTIPRKYQIGNQILLKNNKVELHKFEKPYKVDFQINFEKIFLSLINHDMNVYIKNVFDYDYPNI